VGAGTRRTAGAPKAGSPGAGAGGGHGGAVWAEVMERWLCIRSDQSGFHHLPCMLQRPAGGDSPVIIAVRCGYVRGNFVLAHTNQRGVRVTRLDVPPSVH
jgi:hypothetical protein